jgi:hypothetical protein
MARIRNGALLNVAIRYHGAPFADNVRSSTRTMAAAATAYGSQPIWLPVTGILSSTTAATAGRRQLAVRMAQRFWLKTPRRFCVISQSRAPSSSVIHWPPSSPPPLPSSTRNGDGFGIGRSGVRVIYVDTSPPWQRFWHERRPRGTPTTVIAEASARVMRVWTGSATDRSAKLTPGDGIARFCPCVQEPTPHWSPDGRNAATRPMRPDRGLERLRTLPPPRIARKIR